MSAAEAMEVKHSKLTNAPRPRKEVIFITHLSGGF
jgi:hypothetical protein